jgi:hypothetical protein
MSPWLCGISTKKRYGADIANGSAFWLCQRVACEIKSAHKSNFRADPQATITTTTTTTKHHHEVHSQHRRRPLGTFAPSSPTKGLLLTIHFALQSLASATECGKFTKCTLVNLSQSPDSNVFHATGTTLNPDYAVTYNPNDSDRGWSIECDTEGIIDYVKYFLEDGDVKDAFSVPFWIDGDNSGVRVNRFEDLNECGPKTIKVKFYIWSQGDDAPCDSTTIRLNAVCPVAPTKAPVAPTKAPVKPPTKAPVKPPTKAPVRPCHPITCPANSIPQAYDGCADSAHECICKPGYIKFCGKCVWWFYHH